MEDSEEMGYHYGMTIREYREAKGMTISQLAGLWPSKDYPGVSFRYVSDIERGVKHISDLSVLRELARILQIPLWKLGLSEYNPFQEENNIMTLFDKDALEQLIEDTWLIRLSMSVTITEEKVRKLSNIFEKLIEVNPLLKSNKDFLRLYAQIVRLQAIMLVEKKQYFAALSLYREMVRIGEEIQDSVTLALAYSRVGVELLRLDQLKDAISYLEKAKDVSFKTGKELSSLCHAMLARGYAQVGIPEKFERAINTAINLGYSMVGIPTVTNEFVFHAYSGILEEKSNGLILLGNGQGAIKVLPEIEKHITLESNGYLRMWIPLDYAQAHMLEGNIEESIAELRRFYDNIREHNSSRVNNKVATHLEELEDRGYGGLQIVREFREMIAAK